VLLVCGQPGLRGGGGGGGVVHVLLPPLTAVASTCPAECRRCRALRAMARAMAAEETPAAVVGRACWLVQARFGGGDRPNAALAHRFCYARERRRGRQRLISSRLVNEQALQGGLGEMTCKQFCSNLRTRDQMR